MFNALTVANYIIDLVHRQRKVITNLQLQKILYFIQRRAYEVYGSPLFSNDIEKWKLGPVVPDVYHVYKIFGSNPISFQIDDFEESDIAELSSSNESKIIDSVVDEKIDENPFKLVQETHQHYAWKKDEDRILKGEKGIKYSRDELMPSNEKR